MRLTDYLGIGSLDRGYIDKLIESIERIFDELPEFDAYDGKSGADLTNRIIYDLLSYVKMKVLQEYKEIISDNPFLDENALIEEELDSELDIYVNCLDSGFDSKFLSQWQDEDDLDDLMKTLIKEVLNI